MGTQSLLLSPQMIKTYKALGLLGLGALATGGLSRLYTGLRDESFGIGDSSDNLKLLLDKDEYLSSNDLLASPIVTEKEKSLGTKKVAYDFLDDLWNLRRTSTLGSNRPTGNEEATNIPLFWTAALPTLAIGHSLGRTLVDKRLKNEAINNAKKEKKKAIKEFEDALTYEQSTNKVAEEKSNLIKSIDNFYDAVKRYENVVKIASGNAAGIISASGALAGLIGMNAFAKAYKNTKQQIEKSEKEKLLGLNPSYDELYKDLTEEQIEKKPLQVHI